MPSLEVRGYLLAGYLLKKQKKFAGVGSSNALRYFVLTATHLHYFKRDNAESVSFGEERGRLALEELELISVEHGTIFLNLTSSNKLYELKASDETTAVTWKVALEKAKKVVGKQSSKNLKIMSSSSSSGHLPSTNEGIKRSQSEAAVSDNNEEAYDTVPKFLQSGSVRDIGPKLKNREKKILRSFSSCHVLDNRCSPEYWPDILSVHVGPPGPPSRDGAMDMMPRLPVRAHKSIWDQQINIGTVNKDDMIMLRFDDRQYACINTGDLEDAWDTEPTGTTYDSYFENGIKSAPTQSQEVSVLVYSAAPAFKNMMKRDSIRNASCLLSAVEASTSMPDEDKPEFFNVTCHVSKQRKNMFKWYAKLAPVTCAAITLVITALLVLANIRLHMLGVNVGVDSLNAPQHYIHSGTAAGGAGTPLLTHHNLVTEPKYIYSGEPEDVFVETAAKILLKQQGGEKAITADNKNVFALLNYGNNQFSETETEAELASLARAIHGAFEPAYRWARDAINLLKCITILSWTILIVIFTSQYNTATMSYWKVKEDVYTIKPINWDRVSKSDKVNDMLTRFLRADKGDKKVAQKRWKETVKWRKDNKVDSILFQKHEDFDFFKKYYPQVYHKVPSGVNFYFERPGAVAFSQFKKSGKSIDQALWHYMWITEFLWVVLEPDQENGRNVSILDGKGMGFSDAFGSSMDFVKKGMAFQSKCYPERAAVIFLINVPSWFETIWKMVKPWVDPVTLKKIFIMKSGYESKLLEFCQPNELPEAYGGACKCEEGSAPYFFDDVSDDDDEEEDTARGSTSRAGTTKPAENTASTDAAGEIPPVGQPREEREVYASVIKGRRKFWKKSMKKATAYIKAKYPENPSYRLNVDDLPMLQKKKRCDCEVNSPEETLMRIWAHYITEISEAERQELEDEYMASIRHENLLSFFANSYRGNYEE